MNLFHQRTIPSGIPGESGYQPGIPYFYPAGIPGYIFTWDVDSLTDLCSENQSHESVTPSVCLENQSSVTNENDSKGAEIW